MQHYAYAYDFLNLIHFKSFPKISIRHFEFFLNQIVLKKLISMSTLFAVRNAKYRVPYCPKKVRNLMGNPTTLINAKMVWCFQFQSEMHKTMEYLIAIMYALMLIKRNVLFCD